MTYRKIYFDGCNGWCLGELVEAEPVKGRIRLEDEGAFGSRNRDGLFESESGETLLVPVGGGAK